MKIALYSRPLRDNANSVVIQILRKLLAKNCEIFYFENILSSIPLEERGNERLMAFDPGKEVKPDLLIALGGDGTILDTVSLENEIDCPVLGINLGRLGFMAGVGKDQIDECIEDIFNGTLIHEKRTLLQLEGTDHRYRNLALNECAITNKNRSVLIEIKVWIDQTFLTTYWADGLIISTATGSTGYSLSCGGPILMPSAENFVITPIAPHNLNVRPLIVPESASIRFRIENEEGEFLLSMDSHSRTIDSGIDFKLSKAEKEFSLMSLSKGGFINALKSKLFWGQDLRNASSL